MSPSTKRSRHDNKREEIEPSQVVFVNGLKRDVTEADFHDSLSQYGPIAYVLCLGDKALVEFETLRAAKECVMEASVGSVEVAGYKVNIQFSKSDYIRRSGLESQYANNVLIVAVYNVLYPVTVDVIYQISSIHGRVMRIALIKGKGFQGVQALVEFDCVASAKCAKMAMNGADIYSGCCTLKVEFSKVEKVTVKSNTHDQWDYTVNSPTLPSLTQFSQSNIIDQLKSFTDSTRDMNFQHENSFTRSYFPTSSNPSLLSPKHNYSGCFNYSAPPPTSYENMLITRKRKLEESYTIPAVPSTRSNSSSVIMIYGLSQNHFNCDKVFNLVCPYGDCLKVKFLHSQSDCCMVEMKSETDAYRVIKYLQGSKIYDNVIELTFSHQESIRLPTNSTHTLTDGTAYYKSFVGNRNLRFSNPDLATKNRMAHPCKKVHFFNSPPTFTDYGIAEIFEKYGLKPERIIMLKKTERSSTGFAQFETISDALKAIVLCNHVPIKSDCSKNPYVFKLAFAVEREDY